MWIWGRMATSAEDKAALEKLVALINHPVFRLGGAGRRGYGRIRCIRHSYFRACEIPQRSAKCGGVVAQHTASAESLTIGAPQPDWPATAVITAEADRSLAHQLSHQ